MTIGEILTKFQEEGLKVSDEGCEVFDAVFISDDLSNRPGCLDALGYDDIPESKGAGLDGWVPVATVKIDGSAQGIKSKYICPCFIVWDCDPKAFEVYKAIVQ